MSTHLSVDQLELALDVACILVLSEEDHLCLAVHVCPVRPVAVAPYPRTLLLLCQHHNAGTLVLPYHAPEVSHSVGEGALCGYEGFLPYVPLQQRRV